MSEETCPDCGFQKSPVGKWVNGDNHCSSWMGLPDTVAKCRERAIALLRSQLSAATARASELERELAEAHRDGAVSYDALDLQAHERDTELAAMGERVAKAERQLKALDLLCGFVSEEDGTVAFRVLEGGQRHCQVKLIYGGRGDDAGRAALALCERLNLIAPSGKGET